jgi:cytoskeletal protein CcmA (bactofilin family)
MLGKDKRENETEKSKVETILGNGTKVEGDIYTKGSLRIEGEVIGNIKAEGDLFIGEDGSLQTEIEARNVVLAGKVKGNIIALQKLKILPSGVLNGDIKANKLIIEEGAIFNGSSVPLKDTDLNNSKKEEKVKTNQ